MKEEEENLSEFSAKKLLAMAVKAERDSNRTDKRLRGRVKNPPLKEKFAVLAFEEKRTNNMSGAFSSLNIKTK